MLVNLLLSLNLKKTSFLWKIYVLVGKQFQNKLVSSVLNSSHSMYPWASSTALYSSMNLKAATQSALADPSVYWMLCRDWCFQNLSNQPLLAKKGSAVGDFPRFYFRLYSFSAFSQMKLGLSTTNFLFWSSIHLANFFFFFYIFCHRILHLRYNLGCEWTRLIDRTLNFVRIPLVWLYAELVDVMSMTKHWGSLTIL